MLYIQKMGLALQCPSCLTFYDKPMLLSCNHIVCRPCVSKPALFGLECPECKHGYSVKDLREAPYIENLVSIYRSLDSTFSSHILQPILPDLERASEPVTNAGDMPSKSIGQYSIRQGLKRSADDFVANNPNGGSTSLSEVHDLHTKKKKQSNICSEVLETCSLKKSRDSSGNGNTKSTSSNSFTCGFCQTWKVTEYTGEMLHYYKSKLVEGNDALHADTIHVHRKCIEWAPQIYYENDTVKNLKKELARGAKLKCSYCGIKGATLGCYAKTCRRSYHVPCSLLVEECSWDTENYLMLCPDHPSFPFPNKKPSKRGGKRQAGTMQINSQESSSWEPLPAGVKKWVLCGSALSVNEKFLLVKFASMCKATVVKSWTPNVTHLIAATDANGSCSRTLKVLMAILEGCWILKLEWIKACMEAMHPVVEEPYEVCIDNHGCQFGPRTRRLRALTDTPKLFRGLKFLLTGGFVPTYKEGLQDLIVAAGGMILDSEDQLLGQMCDTKTEVFRTFVVYCSDSTLAWEDSGEVPNRRAKAETLAAGMRAEVIAHTWLLDSIALCKLQPIGQR
ncbi:hypothetical protein Dimus_032438 [Dionaea muscipula]